jgi:hypothetical protein
MSLEDDVMHIHMGDVMHVHMAHSDHPQWPKLIPSREGASLMMAMVTAI